MKRIEPIMKEGIDIRASLAQLEIGESVMFPFRNDFKPSSIRVAISRINAEGGARYSAHETINGTFVERAL